MKIINLQGLTTGERLAYLEELCQDIYNHLYDDYIWTFDGAYVDNESTYTATRLNGYQDNLDLKTGQIVYFAGSGVVALIDKINDVSNTFTVKDNYSIKGDKGDKGEQGIQGEKGNTGETGAIALEYGVLIVNSSDPVTNGALTSVVLNYNRTPVTGDKVTVTVKNSTTNKLFVCTCSVVSVQGSMANLNVNSVYDTSTVLPASARKQLYEHYFGFSINTNSNNSIVLLIFNWIDANPNIVSPIPTTIEEIITYLKTINSNKLLGNGSIETSDGTTVSDTLHCTVYNVRHRTDGKVVADGRMNNDNRIITVDIETFVNNISDYNITYLYNDAIAIGAGSDNLNALVLYSDKNGVLLDTPESLEKDFAALKAAGSDESKILESINTVRSMMAK